jgi:hypothetical protein
LTIALTSATFGLIGSKVGVVLSTTKGLKMSRGLEEFNAAIEATNLIIPNKDVLIQNFDKIVARVIKFGKLNEIKWKGKEGKPDNITQHIRIYLHVYSWFAAESQEYRKDIANKVVTINPRVAWLPELVALQRSLAEDNDNKEEIFRHKIQIWRKDRKLPQGDGKYGYIEITDQGVDDSFREDEHEAIADVDDAPREVDRVAEKAKPVVNFVELFAKASTVEDAYKIMKERYDAESDGDTKELIVKEYRAAKDRIVGKMISTYKDPVEAARTFAAKYYAKEPQKHAELIEYGEMVARSRKESVEEEEDNIPF